MRDDEDRSDKWKNVFNILKFITDEQNYILFQDE